MARKELPAPSISISNTDARRFMLSHHCLWPPRNLGGKTGILDYIRLVGSIQFDPINVVGRNPDLVLQSRVKNYHPELLYELLYEDRTLLDGWDKVASIYLTQDRPYFDRYITRMIAHHGAPDNPPMMYVDQVLEEIREKGPLSSLDFKGNERLSWSWGQQSSMAKASLEVLYAIGKLGIHHRLNTRRYFDLIERLLSEEIIQAPAPNRTEEQYQDWHVLRRVGSLGLANPGGAEHWLGIIGVKSPERRAALWRLVENGDLIPLSVEGLPKKTLFIRTLDLPQLDAVQAEDDAEFGAAFIAPLDNMIWDRALLRWIFDYAYIWEVYKPTAQREYGYYVLPVLYGDRFVARFEPVFDKKSRELIIKNWWWESGIQTNTEMEKALLENLRAFCSYLDTSALLMSEWVVSDPSLGWIHCSEYNE